MSVNPKKKKKSHCRSSTPVTSTAFSEDARCLQSQLTISRSQNPSRGGPPSSFLPGPQPRAGCCTHQHVSLWLLHSFGLASCDQECVSCVLRAPCNPWLGPVANGLFLLCSVPQPPGTERHQIHPCRGLHPIQEAEANVSSPGKKRARVVLVWGLTCHVLGGSELR